MGGHSQGRPNSPGVIPLELDAETGVPGTEERPDPVLREMAEGGAAKGRLGRCRSEEAKGLLPHTAVGLDSEWHEAGGEHRARGVTKVLVGLGRSGGGPIGIGGLSQVPSRTRVHDRGVHVRRHGRSGALDPEVQDRSPVHGVPTGLRNFTGHGRSRLRQEGGQPITEGVMSANRPPPPGTGEAMVAFHISPVGAPLARPGEVGAPTGQTSALAQAQAEARTWPSRRRPAPMRAP